MSLPFLRDCTAIAGSTLDIPASCLSVTYLLYAIQGTVYPVVSYTVCDQQPGHACLPLARFLYRLYCTAPLGCCLLLYSLRVTSKLYFLALGFLYGFCSSLSHMYTALLSLHFWGVSRFCPAVCGRHLCRINNFWLF